MEYSCGDVASETADPEITRHEINNSISLTQYFRDSLTGRVRMPMTGLKMPSPSPQPMSLSLISNENIFSLVSYTVRRFFVSQTTAFCWRFIHCDPTKIGACLH